MCVNVETVENALAGNECESTRNCIEANIFRHESANISPDMGLCDGCHSLCPHSDELPEQGIEHFA